MSLLQRQINSVMETGRLLQLQLTYISIFLDASTHLTRLEPVMSPGEVLDQIREYYVDRFIKFVQERADQATNDHYVVHECAFSDATGKWVTEGKLALPMRGDMFLIQDSQIVKSLQVDTEGMLSFEPFQFVWPETPLHVDVAPFQWNWLQLRLVDLQENSDWTPLRTWFFHWFQEDDAPEDELLGGVHFLSDPEICDDYTQLSIDLGTAPVEAFEELLDAIVELGVAHVRIGQFDKPT